MTHYARTQVIKGSCVALGLLFFAALATAEPATGGCTTPDPSDIDVVTIIGIKKCVIRNCDGTESRDDAITAIYRDEAYKCENGQWVLVSCTYFQVTATCVEETKECSGRGPDETIRTEKVERSISSLGGCPDPI